MASPLSQDELDKDAISIASVLNIWDIGNIRASLNKYRHEESHKRRQLALKEYFNKIDLDLPLNFLQDEARLIKNIFPKYTEEDILSILQLIGNEDNRIRIAVQMLLNRNTDVEQTLKRSSPFDDLTADASVLKKLKVTTTVSGPEYKASSSVAHSEIATITSDTVDGYHIIEAQHETANIFEQKFNAIANEYAPPTNATTQSQIAVDEETSLSNKIGNKVKALWGSLAEIFPDACPEFLRNICQGKTNTPQVLDDLISEVLQSGNTKQQNPETPECNPNVQEQLETLKQILPDADPDFLEIKCEQLIDRPEELQTFIAEAVEHHNYPTMFNYIRKQQLSAQQKQYTTEFNIEKFLEVIPNPREYFSDPKRKPVQLDLESRRYALCVLNNHFQISMSNIKTRFTRLSYDFLKTCKYLEALPEIRGKKRPLREMPATIQNIPLLQEIAFYKHREEIDKYLNEKKNEERREREEAKQKGLLLTCDCCFNSEVMPKDICTCKNGCHFCKECVRKGVEVAFGDGRLDFACFNNCSSEFSLQTLQAVLTPKMFSKVALKKQVEEVKAAGIDDLESCPFCDFVAIPAAEDKLFRCFNPDCMKESCRLCKEPSHLPLRCDEVEKPDDIRRRTYIENKMTEALLRTCYKCQKKFIKIQGCNHMTCSCGAQMCYVCLQPLGRGWQKHFSKNGCPIHTNMNQLHQGDVLKGAEAAKQELGVINSTELKIDPIVFTQQYYQELENRRNRNRGNLGHHHHRRAHNHHRRRHHHRR